MRGFLAAVLVGLALPALAQSTTAPQTPVPQTLTMRITAEQAMLIANTLGQIRCDSVQAMATCDKARELLAEIQRQARDQIK